MARPTGLMPWSGELLGWVKSSRTFRSH